MLFGKYNVIYPTNAVDFFFLLFCCLLALTEFVWFIL